VATVIGALLSIAVIAAVTEEISFRGYIQRPLEEAYGIVPAVLVVGFLFWAAHLDHGITVTHLPFHMAASIALGLLAYFTRSLVPAMIAHGVGDILLQPAYFFHHPEFVWRTLSARPVWEGVSATLPERLFATGRAISPRHWLISDPFQGLAITAWILFLSSALTILAFRHLIHISASSYGNAKEREQAI
jgi:hypothetical protein